MNTPARPAVDPTAKSMYPLSRSRATGTASTAVAAICVRTSLMLDVERNLSDWVVKNTTSAISATTMPWRSSHAVKRWRSGSGSVPTPRNAMSGPCSGPPPSPGGPGSSTFAEATVAADMGPDQPSEPAAAVASTAVPAADVSALTSAVNEL